MVNAKTVKQPNIIRPRAYAETTSVIGDETFKRPHLYIDKQGNQKAEPGEVFDLNGYIQEQAGSTDIAAILARVEVGDTSVINVNPNGFIGDSTILPKDLFDVKRYDKIYQDAEANFNKLPDEVKALFDNDSSNFFNSVMTGKVNQVMADYEAKKKQAESNPAEGGNE